MYYLGDTEDYDDPRKSPSGITTFVKPFETLIDPGCLR